ncbi:MULTISPECIES: hypothetical protein [unclassified Sphingomonas]|jgi:opacity protein-like surface antigen|uniref:hypothetical protein n=1 Tax=unclassified Sphingomonas TaxID=196159 RepID=UPI00226ACD32|nr:MULTISPECIES: hypothetical protein [unclassified Sphingomonas]
MRKMIMAMSMAALTMAAAANAERPVNARQLNQERRIDAGTRSGKLTHSEASRLKSEQRSIANLKTRLKARHGGHLTAADKRLIHRKQERANSHILAQKRDAQRGKNHLKL